jgi:hypothetical protein
MGEQIDGYRPMDGRLEGADQWSAFYSQAERGPANGAGRTRTVRVPPPLPCNDFGAVTVPWWD